MPNLRRLVFSVLSLLVLSGSVAASVDDETSRPTRKGATITGGELAALDGAAAAVNPGAATAARGEAGTTAAAFGESSGIWFLFIALGLAVGLFFLLK